MKHGAERQPLIGRAEERRQLAAIGAMPEDPRGPRVVFIHGPGGVGKTDLLLHHAGLCRERRVACTYVDLRNVEDKASPDSFLRAFAKALRIPDHRRVIETLAARRRPSFLLVDTYERIESLDAWVRGSFVAGLAARLAIVIAGRNPPSPEWCVDASWSGRFQVLPLDNLTETDSARMLERFHVPAAERPAILEFTRGHPLALVLVGQLFAARPGFHFEPAQEPDVLRTLLYSFVDRVPGPVHRATVEAAAVVRALSEPLLASLLAESDVADKFDWLRRLSFVQSGPYGLFPHDLVRDVLIADLRWRNPEWHEKLVARAHEHYVTRSRVGGIRDQLRWVGEMVFLYRHNPAFVKSFGLGASGGLTLDAAGEADVPALLDMVRCHEGDASAAIAARWFRRQLHHVRVVRDESGVVLGFRAFIDLTRARPADIRADPGAQAAWRYVRRHAPVRPGQVVTVSRFNMTREGYHNPSPAQQLLGHSAMHHFLTTSRLAVSCMYTSKPEQWAATYALLGIVRAEEGDFELEGHRYALSVLDLRIESPAAWSRRIAMRFVALAPPAEAPPAEPPKLALSHSDFAAELRLVLGAFGRPERLATLRILGARLISDRVPPGAGNPLRVEALRSLLREAAESLRSTPQGSKHHDALVHTYLEPIGSQQDTADYLDLPFSTYRRHLGQAIDDVIESLWQREIGAL